MSKRKSRYKRPYPWKQLNKLDKIFVKTRKQRSRKNESLVEEILEELIKEKEIIKIEKRWALDRIGIDFLIFLQGPERFAIQVKSSPRGAKKHHEKYGKRRIKFRNKYIRCLILIVGPEDLSDKKRLKDQIKNFIKANFKN